MQKYLIVFGLILIAVGLFWPCLLRLKLRRLPGDIFFQRGNLSFYFPITTCLLISGVITIIILIFNIMKK
ncbi:MAG: DUF2905 domain-containing protein [Candidatus Rickettsia vulgarisii]